MDRVDRITYCLSMKRLFLSKFSTTFFFYYRLKKITNDTEEIDGSILRGGERSPVFLKICTKIKQTALFFAHQADHRYQKDISISFSPTKQTICNKTKKTALFHPPRRSSVPEVHKQVFSPIKRTIGTRRK